MRKFVINGKVLINEHKRGVERYINEIILALDSLIEEEDIELIVPKYSKYLPSLKKIKIKEYGKICPLKGWQYTAYQYYILKNNAVDISLAAGLAPLISPGIVAIHDLRFEDSRLNDIRGLGNKLRYIYNRIIDYNIVKRSKKIITVSNFTKNRILHHYNSISSKNIMVVYSACSHIKKINRNKIDNKKYMEYENKIFYFYLGGIEKNKNLRWIYNVAKRYKSELFLVAGPPLDKGNLHDNINIFELKNVIHLGYLTDDEISFFFSKCKAFLFPSIYEGFGLPPLEALCFGAKVLCSNSSCLPEVYEDCVTYFDPYDYNVDLDKLLKNKVANPKKLFEKYTWENSAKRLYQRIKEMNEV